MVDMNNTNIVHTGHYHNFRPYQVDVDNLPTSSKGRESKVYTPDVLALLNKNPDKWFVIQEVEFDSSDKKGIATKRSVFYQSSKLHVLKFPNLEYLVRGETKEDGRHILRLISRFISEDK